MGQSQMRESVQVVTLTFRTIFRNLFSQKFESEVYVLNRLIHAGDVCIDIGAAYGRYTLWISRLVGREGRVYSFEPGLISFRILNNAIRFHRLGNVIAMQRALSNRPGQVKLAIPIKASGRRGLSLAHLATEENSQCVYEKIEAVTVDAFCREMQLERIDFIKCDVEGAEGLVFEGAQAVLSRDHPTVLCELDPGFLRRFGTIPNQILEQFHRLGYRVFVLAHGGRFEAVERINHAHNYFFVHPSRQTLDPGRGDGGMGDRPKLSLAVITKNEEHNIRECLESGKDWVDEMVVVDDQSTDRTCAIAGEFTEKVFIRKMDLEGRHRNWAVSQASYDWVIWLDADERLTPELKQEIDEILSAADGKTVAFWIPSKNYLGSTWLRYGGWSAAHIRLYHKHFVRWKELAEDVVHPGIEIAEGYRGAELKKPLLHYNFKDIEDFIQKMNRQSTLEAVKLHLQGKDLSLLHGLWRAFDRFWKRYVYKMGFRDGYYGFIAAFLSGFYQLAAYSKLREIKEKGLYLEKVQRKVKS